MKIPLTQHQVDLLDRDTFNYSDNFFYGYNKLPKLVIRVSQYTDYNKNREITGRSSVLKLYMSSFPSEEEVLKLRGFTAK